jgi:hypothetical protein
MANQQNATTSDAELILKLYDLRRESEMRKARNFIAQFAPKNFDELSKVFFAWGTQENAWIRQVLSYWEMAASLALRGAVNSDLFFDNSGEMFFVYTKFKPFLKDLREKFEMPEFLTRVETYINGTQEGRDRLKMFEERMAKFAAMQAQAGKAHAAD